MDPKVKRLADELIDAANKRDTPRLQKAYAQLREADPDAAEGFKQVMRGQGHDLDTLIPRYQPAGATLDSPQAKSIGNFIHQLREDTENHGLKAVMDSGSVARVLQDLKPEDVASLKPLLRDLSRDVASVKSYVTGRLDHFKRNPSQSPEMGFLMLATTMFRQLEGAVESALGKAPAEPKKWWEFWK